MKKRALTTAGLAGACVACCALPLALPLVAGVSVTAGATAVWDCLGEFAGVAVGSVAIALAGAGTWWYLRSRTPSRCAIQEGPSRCNCASSPDKALQ